MFFLFLQQYKINAWESGESGGTPWEAGTPPGERGDPLGKRGDPLGSGESTLGSGETTMGSGETIQNQTFDKTNQKQIKTCKICSETNVCNNINHKYTAQAETLKIE